VIGENRNQINPEASKSKIALRDAFVVFLMVLITQLLAEGYPPTIKALYIALLTGAAMGVLSYMHALGIKKPEE